MKNEETVPVIVRKVRECAKEKEHTNHLMLICLTLFAIYCHIYYLQEKTEYLFV